MGWFNKKEKEEVKTDSFRKDIPELPKLPDLPELPEIRDINKPKINKEPLPQLPSFPNTSLGQKFSQNIIKQAVTSHPKERYNNYPEGKRGERVFEADDFAPSIRDNRQMMPKPLKPMPRKEFNFPKTREIEPREEPEFEFNIEDFRKKPGIKEEPEFEEEEPERYIARREPVFIRIDRFEESLKTFEKAKRELGEIEKVLTDIEKVKEDEQNELESWKSNVLKIKEQIEKVDRDVFSRLE